MGDLWGCFIYFSKTQEHTSRNEEMKLVRLVLNDLLIDDMCEISKIDLYNLWFYFSCI